MNFSGLTVRYFSDINRLSFLLENFQTDALEVFGGGDMLGGTGKEMRFGFTGIHANTGWFFSFKNGKMIDPEGRFFYSYNDTDLINLSGNISTGSYDYYVNNELICAIGAKSNFDINGWYSQGISGAVGSGNVYINSPPISTTLTFTNSFVSGTSWSGKFSHNNSGPLAIRSGELRLTDSNLFQISGTCLSFNNGTNIVASGINSTVALNHTGTTSRTGLYIVGVRVYTDFGPVDFTISGSGIAASSNVVSNSLYSDTTGYIIATGATDIASKYWYYSTQATNLSGVPITKPIYLELSYVSGATGNFSLVTGFQLTSPGSGYTTTPVYATVVSAGDGYPLASGICSVSGTNNGISGVNWLTSGFYTGATGALNITFSSISGLFASGKPLCAPSYSKSFSGNFQFVAAVGINGSNLLLDSAYNIFSGNGILSTGHNTMFMTINYSGSPDSGIIRYNIKASGLTDSISNINIYTGSGLAYTSL